MSKLKFLFLGLCMIVALVGCPSPVEEAPVVATPDPIGINGLVLLIDSGDMTYTVSQDGTAVIDNKNAVYTLDTSVSGTKKLYKMNGSTEKFIGFQGTGKGDVRFFTAVKKDDVFKVAAEQYVTSKNTWKESKFFQITGRSFEDTATLKKTFKFYSEGTGADVKNYFDLNSTTAGTSLEGKYELVKIYSETQALYKKTAGTGAYSITKTENSDSIKSNLSTLDAVPDFVFGMGDRSVNIKYFDDEFLNNVKDKYAKGKMGSLDVAYDWTADGRSFKFGTFATYTFTNAINPLTGIYTGGTIVLAPDVKTGSMTASAGVLPFTFAARP